MVFYNLVHIISKCQPNIVLFLDILMIKICFFFHISCLLHVLLLHAMLFKNMLGDSRSGWIHVVFLEFIADVGIIFLRPVHFISRNKQNIENIEKKKLKSTALLISKYLYLFGKYVLFNSELINRCCQDRHTFVLIIYRYSL